MRRLTLALLGAGLAAVFVLAPPAARAEWTAPCVARTTGPLCHFWMGKVKWVDDGDTLTVQVLDSRKLLRVRLIGVQAMEQTVYISDPRRRRGECHAVEATGRLERLISLSRGFVRLSAQRPESRVGFRWRRSVGVRIGKAWHDVGQILLAEGHALWLPNAAEWAWNVPYSKAAQQAAAARLGLWNTEACAFGPPGTLRVSVHPNAKGRDSENLNGEWVRIENIDPFTHVSLEGWWVRDSALRRYRFPWWAVIPPGERIRVRVGAGEPSDHTFYWGLDRPAFENPRRIGNGLGLGDGAYLFDPHGDLLGWNVYPCYFGCAWP
jgi:endonuclease YncB( thermonuclease family)